MLNKKDKRGLSVGGFILIVLGVFVGLALLVASAQQRGTMVDLTTVANGTLGTLTNGTPTYITNYKYCDNFKIWNATGNVQIPASNFTVTNNVVYNGNEAIQVDPAVLVTATGAFNRGVATFDGVCQPLTYDNNSASRTISGLIILFAGLGLAIFVLEKSEVTNLFGR